MGKKPHFRTDPAIVADELQWLSRLMLSMIGDYKLAYQLGYAPTGGAKQDISYTDSTGETVTSKHRQTVRGHVDDVAHFLYQARSQLLGAQSALGRALGPGGDIDLDPRLEHPITTLEYSDLLEQKATRLLKQAEQARKRTRRRKP
ncbi:MAG TPA: hypothetical protein VII76_11370 [Acidimicrobiales bacterium]